MAETQWWRAVAKAVKDAFTDVLDTERECSIVIQAFEELDASLLKQAGMRSLAPFMQPAAEYEDEPPEEGDSGEAESEPQEIQGRRAGRGQ